MNINVEYKDKTGNISSRNYYLTLAAFVKHLAIAGQAYAPRPRKILRAVGMFLYYSSYMRCRAFYDNRFSEPPFAFSDPTEKGHFSTLVGKAIADFLSKRIDHSLYTVNYEAVMRLNKYKLTGQRPDLVAYSQTSMFAIEAKGRHQNNPGNMRSHKTQALSGPIKVNYSVACVSYNLFNRIACNYHDPPFSDNVPYDNKTLSALTIKYYSGLLEFLQHELFEYREVWIQGERFYEIELRYNYFDKYYSNKPLWLSAWYLEMMKLYRLRLILPNNIQDYASNGITNGLRPFKYEFGENDDLYIDNDRVGIHIEGRE